MTMVLRFVWLIPVTGLALLLLKSGLRELQRAATGWGTFGPAAVLLLLAAAALTGVYVAWRNTIKALRGETELSTRGNTYGAAAVIVVCLLIMLLIARILG